eukprot:gnl/Ergobibamus_cyprinoides/2656.p2 GENE.gnl/Ergobibamus_cyprinoides/2656~~gnl/Ergobibamus_cyprinoides/2656.p2  ORF type:complete len:100 (+),score=26.11 gnl/Ergobibamus_cyprinoides/2656:72-371(+)
MPVMQPRIEGRGNGIKTAIDNMSGLASALGRDPRHLTKFFGFELGSQSRFDPKTGFATINGAHDLRALNGHLKTFITEFVLCPQCGLPETHFKPSNEGH